MNVFNRICTGPIHKAKPVEDRFHSAKCFYFANKDQSGSKDLSLMAPRLGYRDRLSFCCRKSESSCILNKYEDKLPVIIQRFASDKRLPQMDNCQFVIPKRATIGQVQHIIKQRLGDFKNSAIYVLVANKELPPLTVKICDLYSKYKDDDGFLYIYYSSEDCYG